MTSRVPSWVFGFVGLIGLVVVWEVLGRTVFADRHVVPPPSAILRQLGHDGVGFYWPNVRTTLREAGLGPVLAVLFSGDTSKIILAADCGSPHRPPCSARSSASTSAPNPDWE